MYEGKKITLGGTEYILPALSLAQLRGGALKLIRDHDELVGAGKFYDACVIRGEIIGVALRRNYPDMEDEKVLASIDLNNMNDIWASVLGMSGFEPAPPSDEGAATGPLALDTTSGSSIEPSPERTVGPLTLLTD